MTISRRMLLGWGALGSTAFGTLVPCAAWAQANAAPPAVWLANRYRAGMTLQDYWASVRPSQKPRTRGGETVHSPDWFTQGWPATPMDGELWAGRGQFSHAQSTTRQQQPQDAAWRRMAFMVFDLPAHGGSFDERLPALRETVAHIGQQWVKAVPQHRIATDAELQALLRRIVRAGGEGLMLHRGSAPYRSGRSDDLLKVKTHDDAEARVIAHLPGQGKHAGVLGALLVETPEGQRFKLGTGFSDAERRAPPPVGSWVTYRFRGTHDGGLPRFASYLRVREDMAPVSTKP